MTRVRIRRRSARPRHSLTAAAQRVEVQNGSSFRQSTLGANGWQEQAWYYVEKVAELQYWVSWRAWSASRCRFVASALDAHGAPTGSLADDDPNATRVREIVNDIAGGVVGQARLIHRAAYLTSVVGEYWVAMIVRDAARETAVDGTMIPVDISRPGYDREQWYVFGREQLSQASNSIALKLPDGTKHEFLPGVDLLFRVWQEHPQDPTKPVSPIWSCREVLEGIVQADATIKASNNSRLNGNGILFVPQEMSLPSQVAPTALPVGAPDTADPPPLFEPHAAQALQDLLFEVAATAKKDPNSAAAQNPIIAAVPGDLIKLVTWIRPGNDVPETTLKIQEADIRRLAMGLDTAPERLLGMSEGNHWSAWAIDENDIKVHVAPVVELLAQGLTQEALRPKLAEEGIDPDAYVIWYDTTALTQDPDKGDEAMEGFDRGAVSARALREHLGFDDEDGYDLTTADGWVQLALDKIALDPANAGIFMPIIEAAAAKVGLEVAPPPAALPPSPPGEDDESPADSEPDEPDEPPNPADDASVTAALSITRLCVTRALELANKRRRTRALSELYRDVPIEMAHTRLEPLSLADANASIKGWATGLVDDDIRRLGLDPAQLRALVEGVACLALITASEPVITRSMLRSAAL